MSIFFNRIRLQLSYIVALVVLSAVSTSHAQSTAIKCQDYVAFIVDGEVYNRPRYGATSVERLSAVSEEILTTEIYQLVPEDLTSMRGADLEEEIESFAGVITEEQPEILLIHYSAFNDRNQSGESERIAIFLATIEAVYSPKLYIIFSRSINRNPEGWRDRVASSVGNLNIIRNRIVMIENRKGIPRWHPRKDDGAIKRVDEEIRMICSSS